MDGPGPAGRPILDGAADVAFDDLVRRCRGRSPSQPVRAHLSGPPGSGKSRAAASLAEMLERDLYRIDLDALTSKYIGETEKNLSQIFDRAETDDSILLFDEADALFGRDRPGIDVLLRLLETYSGIVLVLTTDPSWVDDEFLQHIDVIVNTSCPTPPTPRGD